MISLVKAMKQGYLSKVKVIHYKIDIFSIIFKIYMFKSRYSVKLYKEQNHKLVRIPKSDM